MIDKKRRSLHFFAPKDRLRYQNPFFGRKEIPVTYQGNYNTLIEAAYKSKDEPVYLKATCLNTSCAAINTLRLRPWFVERYCVLFDSAGNATHTPTPVPLSVCDLCKRRFRVLPIEILPYKTYSLPLIETACRLYCISDYGLRKTVNGIPGDAPHYSTLHGWLGGIGERALDKTKIKSDKAVIGEPSLPPTSALVAETAQKKDSNLINQWNKTDPPIPTFKFKSILREEHLKACFRLLIIALSLFSNSPLTMWEKFLLPIFNVPCWMFPSRPIVSTIQLTDFKENVLLIEKNKTSQRGPP